MKKRIFIIGCLVLSLSLFGCSPKEEPANSETPASETPAVEEPSSELPTDEGAASGTSPKLTEDAAKAMQEAKSIDGIKSISMSDIEGNPVDRTFTDEEIAEIQTAFNDSFIMDTAYIEMITGMTMTIELEDGRSVFIHSYGQEDYVVATFSDGPSFHLGCSLIGKMLLEGTEAK